MLKSSRALLFSVFEAQRLQLVMFWDGNQEADRE